MFKRFLKSSHSRKAVVDTPEYGVLVVSDDLITSALVCETLAQNHYRVHSASGINSALELLKSIDTPALMIGDFARPEVDGVDFLKRARIRLGRRSLPPVLFLMDAKDDEVVAGRVGAQELLTKPLDPTALVTCVSKLVEGRETTIGK
jgi:DNA-binding response OmpR family regulator